MKKWIILLTFASTGNLFGQTDSDWMLHFQKQSTKQYMFQKDSDDFYLAKNAVYGLEFEPDSLPPHRINKHYGSKLTGISKDSLYLIDYFNAYEYCGAYGKWDTLHYGINQLKKIHLSNNKYYGASADLLVSDYQITPIQDPKKSRPQSKMVQVYKGDSTYYEVMPFLTVDGYDYLFEINGQTYFYHGRVPKPGTSGVDTTYRVRNIAWFTPNRVEKINGLAIGVYPANIKNDGFNGIDSLTINGLNIELMPFVGFLLLIAEAGVNEDLDHFTYEHVLLEKKAERSTLKMNGLSIGASGLGRSNAIICGVNLAGLYTSAKEIHGVSASGVFCSTYLMNGISLAGLLNTVGKGNGLQIGAFNRAVQINGIQIGLYNQAKKIRGLQIGLWNDNGRFSLPFINFRW